MKKLSQIVFYLAIFLLLSACNKKVEEIPYSNNPVFSIEGTIGTENVSIVAGENAEFKTEVQNINGVNFFKGTMLFQGNELSIGWYDGNISKEKFDPSAILTKDKFAYTVKNQSPIFSVSSTDFSSVQDLQLIHWYVNDVYYGDNVLNIVSPGKYTICGIYVYANGDEIKLCNEMIIGFEKNEVFNLQYLIEKDKNITVWINGATEEIKSVRWFNNDKWASALNTLSMTPNPGANFITAEIYFKNGSMRKRNIMINNTEPGESIPDFGVLENSTNTFQDYTVVLGVKFGGFLEYSTEITDNVSNYVTINGFNYFGKDSNGVPVYLLKGVLKAKAISPPNPIPIDIDLKFSWGVPLK